MRIACRTSLPICVVVAAAIAAGCTSSGAGNGTEGSPTPTSSETPTATPTGTSSPTALCSATEAQLFPAQWIDGADCTTEAKIQVHQVDENTWILRQSMCTNYEGPFLYLFFGQDKALLEDTGAGNIQLQTQVQSIVDTWSTAHGKTNFPLVVVHSHAHGDHIQADSQFNGKPNTTLVAPNLNTVKTYFNFPNWPAGNTSIDLGGRVLDVFPIPGHETTHIAIYDHALGWLLTGDTLYPGRLYIQNFADYTQSVKTLGDFVGSHEVCWVMGTHIEMTQQTGVDFDFGSSYHPAEHVLQLSPAHVTELRDAVVAMNGNAIYQVHDDFIIDP